MNSLGNTQIFTGQLYKKTFSIPSSMAIEYWTNNIHPCNIALFH